MTDPIPQPQPALASDICCCGHDSKAHMVLGLFVTTGCQRCSCGYYRRRAEDPIVARVREVQRKQRQRDMPENEADEGEPDNG